jgi:hypothetical protein
MSELRAPDPTLDGLPSLAVALDMTGDPAVAHVSVECAVFLARSTTYLSAKAARWFAVPCRECFPDAPPPGAKTRCCGSPECERGGWHQYANLAWQAP